MDRYTIREPQHVFITGHARSGTTILMQILNSSSEVFMLAEADIHWFGPAPGFVEYFNKRAKNRKSLPLKGFFIPTAVPPDADGPSALKELTKYYKLTGDKIALGPNRSENVHVLPFLTGPHLDAFHIFTFRSPDAAVASMHRMFPAIAAESLLSLWRDAVSLMLCCVSVLPRAYVVPRERIYADLVVRLAEFLQIRPQVFPLALRSDRQPSAEELSWLSDPQRAELNICMEIYNELILYWDPNTLGLHNPATYATAIQFLPELRRIVPNQPLLIDRLGNPATAGTDFRRARIYMLLEKQHVSDTERKIVEDYLLDYPKDALGHYALGNLLLRDREKVKRGIAELSLALSCGYSEFWVRYDRGRGYEMINDIDNAITDTERAVALSPTHEHARQRLQDLRKLRETDPAGAAGAQAAG